MLRNSPCGATSKTATVAVTKRDVSLLKKLIAFQISSGTPRVDTATVAVSDVSPHGLWRNVKYNRTPRFFPLNAENGFLKFKSKDLPFKC